MKLLRRDALEELLEEKYGEGDSRFLAFAESYAPGKSDRALEDVILKMYEFSSSCPDPEAWLESCCRAYRADSVEALEKTPFFAFVQEEVRLAAQTARRLAGRAEALCRQPDGPYMYGDMLESDLGELKRFSFSFKGSGDYRILVTDLLPGTWQVRRNDKVIIPAVDVEEGDGAFYFTGAPGTYEFRR